MTASMAVLTMDKETYSYLSSMRKTSSEPESAGSSAFEAFFHFSRLNAPLKRMDSRRTISIRELKLHMHILTRSNPIYNTVINHTLFLKNFTRVGLFTPTDRIESNWTGLSGEILRNSFFYSNSLGPLMLQK